MKKLFITFLLLASIGLLYSSARRHTFSVPFLNDEINELYYQLNIIARQTKIWWKNPNSWDVANAQTTVGVRPLWTTYNATALTSVNARYIYLLVLYRTAAAENSVSFRENGQSNNADSEVYNSVADILSSSVFWQKMDSDQNFQYQTNVNGETIWIRCIAYREG